MALENRIDANRPASATTSKLSFSGARDFGMKFMPGMEDMPATRAVSHQSADRNPEATQDIQARNEPPSYWNHPSSDAATDFDHEDDDQYHPYLLSWWWMVKGVGLMLAGALTNVLAFGDAVAKLLHHVPLLYGDDTVRSWPNVTGFASGCAAGGKYLCLGIYDGLAGWVVLPYRGAKQEGVVGFLKGFLRAFGAVFFKMPAGGMGFVSHPLFGIYKEAANLRITIKRKRAPHYKDTSPV